MLSDKDKTIQDAINGSVLSAVSTSAVVTTTNSVYDGIMRPLWIQYQGITTDLNAKRVSLQAMVDEQLLTDPTFDGYRDKGVKLAWEYERADLLMGGQGSREYTIAQKNDLLQNGSVRGLEGHHINDVSNHESEQANPDNIQFLARDDHLSAHDGNWQNQTEGKPIDREKMLRGTHAKRVFQNELIGTGITAAIGFGVGFTISAAMELAKTGIPQVNVRDLLKKSVRTGLETAAVSTVSYIGSRLFSSAWNSMFIPQNPVLQIISAGTISLAVTATYQFIKIKYSGIETAQAVDIIGQQMAVPASTMLASALAQGILGISGAIVSTSISVIYIGAKIYSEIHRRHLNDQLQAYTVELYKPVYYV